MTCFIQLAKNGDILSLLPCLYHEFQKTGKPIHLMVAREYSRLLERAPYVQSVLRDDWQDLAGALRQAKRDYRRVVCPQLYGDGFKIQHRHPSWQHDQWDRAGYLDKWDTLPLVLERPKHAAELVKQYLPRPTIIYADHGQSSPFFQKEQLAKLLQDKFGSQYSILRLSQIKLANPLDLLALFDAAKLMVTVDSLPLHLSAASKVPVAALTTDNPSRWHGSAWSKRFIFHCRYSEYEKRADELADAIQNALAGQSSPTITNLKTEKPFGYNPSVVEINGNTLTTYRFHPEPGKWRTELMFNDGKRENRLEPPALFANYSHDDARLFKHDGHLHLSWVIARTVAEQGKNVFRGVVAYGRLAKHGEGYGIVNTVLPAYGRNHFEGIQKNWVPFTMEGRLYFIWGVRDGKQQVVILVNGDVVQKEYVAEAPTWNWGQIRGDVVVPHGNQLLRFFHSREDDRRNGGHLFRYHVGAALMESKPPFATLKISSKPILSGNEEYMPGSPSWKRNVVIPFGCIGKKGQYHLSIGVNDSACRMVELNEKDLNL